jgi:hypothetical protein
VYRCRWGYLIGNKNARRYATTAGLQSYQIISVLSSHISSLTSPLIRSKYFFEMRLPNVTDALGNLTLSNPHRILIVGCAYGGISTVINLLEYSHLFIQVRILRARKAIEVLKSQSLTNVMGIVRHPTLAEVSRSRRCLIHIVAMHEDPVLMEVIHSPFRRSTTRTRNAQVHESYVEKIQPSQ